MIILKKRRQVFFHIFSIISLANVVVAVDHVSDLVNIATAVANFKRRRMFCGFLKNLIKYFLSLISSYCIQYHKFSSLWQRNIKTSYIFAIFSYRRYHYVALILVKLIIFSGD